MLSVAHIRTFTGTYEIDTMPVIKYYSVQDKVAEVCGIFYFGGVQLELMITRSTVQGRWRLFTSQLVQLSRTCCLGSISNSFL